MTPVELAEGLAKALGSRDLAGVQALTTEAGWVPVGGSVRAMAEASMKKPPPPMTAFGAVENGDRAVAGLAMQVQGRVVGKVWVLCERVGEGFKAAGMAQVAAQAGRYLDGTLPAVWDWRAHDANPQANAWVERFIEDLVQERKPEQPRRKGLLRPVGPLVAKGVTAGKVLGGHDLPALGRAVVVFELAASGAAEKFVAVVEVSDDSADAITLAKGPSAAAFFAGLEWERSIEGEPTVTPPGPRRR